MHERFSTSQSHRTRRLLKSLPCSKKRFRAFVRYEGHAKKLHYDRWEIQASNVRAKHNGESQSQIRSQTSLGLLICKTILV
jgi:hypothetical protein